MLKMEILESEIECDACHISLSIPFPNTILIATNYTIDSRVSSHFVDIRLYHTRQYLIVAIPYHNIYIPYYDRVHGTHHLSYGPAHLYIDSNAQGHLA